MTILRTAIAALALGAAPPAGAQPTSRPLTLQQSVEAQLRQAGPGIRFGLAVATEDGRELVAVAPDARFIPASNTKLFTTAAAFATLAGLDRPDAAGGASVALETERGSAPDVVLEGFGDARLSSAPDCAVNCLAALADAVAARTRRVRNVIGDDSFYPDQRWSPGMSWNNIPTWSGTAISALTLDDNELVLRITPGAVGQPPAVAALPYYTIDNRAVTVEAGETDLAYDRLPFSNVLRLTGTIVRGAEPQRIRLGIDDPAYYAAWRLRALLVARGVRVSGTVSAHHRPVGPAAAPPPARRIERALLLRLAPPPLVEDLRVINKASQNLHAELMLRRLGRQNGGGLIADGLVVVRAMLARAGLRRTDYDFSDGSGMSTYNRVTPRGTVTLLRWAAGQPWGAAWRATFPVAAVDGTLARRFRGTALEGRLFAKTGSLNATSALSGYMVARSGRTLIFSIYANDVPDGASATPAMDAVLVQIAERN
ncbi:MAG TPA: D-alanyl-D-alanine carboxypeptidase/D-alanyl-D-alanine-endopeptidase [Allosphingosinicella sp.]|nr:D-alanyl-D-alanine carboxypeptidase/D-alanyl-D-alanine-endopeptidase [Allosphingosinicella sp.]